MQSINYRPIGIVHTPFTSLDNMPIQPSAARDIEGTIEIFPEYTIGLQDIEGFSHIILLYHFHHANTVQLKVIPFLDQQERGIFATRAPVRPNPIGLSIVELVALENNILHIRGVDILDGTPLIDIKPCVEAFDHPSGSRAGWLDGKTRGHSKTKADARFKHTSV